MSAISDSADGAGVTPHRGITAAAENSAARSGLPYRAGRPSSGAIEASTAWNVSSGGFTAMTQMFGVRFPRDMPGMALRQR